jgi:hypothetical protein
MTEYETAKAVLAKAALGDPTLSRPDPGVLAFWAEQMVGIDRDAALRAVTSHYSEEHRRIMPADVRCRVAAEGVADEAAAGNPIPLNHVPDADPDDVPAYLAALRAKRFVNESPTEYHPDRSVATRALIASTLNRKGVTS